VAGLTIVDGADNLAAYTPVFATAGGGQIVVMLVVFAVGVAVWCLAGLLLVRHDRVIGVLARHGHWILPVAFILIGLNTLQRTGHLG
jgi:cadmium resistance protein CadD (predicted permease)